MQTEIEYVFEALQTLRCGAVCTEEELHALVEQALLNAGIDAQHEVRLSPQCRIDFLAGDIGIEIKKSRPNRTKLLEQLKRYAQCDQVGQILVIAPKGVNLPEHIENKRVVMLALERLWGICLP